MEVLHVKLFSISGLPLSMSRLLCSYADRDVTTTTAFLIMIIVRAGREQNAFDIWKSIMYLNTSSCAAGLILLRILYLQPTISSWQDCFMIISVIKANLSHAFQTQNLMRTDFKPDLFLLNSETCKVTLQLRQRDSEHSHDHSWSHAYEKFLWKISLG